MKSWQEVVAERAAKAKKAPEPDYREIFEVLGTFTWLSDAEWWVMGFDSSMLAYALRRGAVTRERKGPRGGWRYAITSREAWEVFIAHRAAFVLTGRHPKPLHTDAVRRLTGKPVV